MVTSRDGPREIHRVVGSGGSFGASPLRQEIGLGNAAAIDSVEGRWPFGNKTSRFKNLSLDGFYELTEDATNARPLEVKKFPWPAASNTHKHHP